MTLTYDRARRTREHRERILDEYEHSGLSGVKFAALCGVKYQTFATWLQRRKRARNTYPKRRPRRKSSGVHWLEASLQPASPLAASGLLLQLPGGARAEILSQQHIALAAALVRALEKPC